MPFANEHAARQRDPDDFAWVKQLWEKESEGIRGLGGQLKSDPKGSAVIQTIRFDAAKWSPAECKEWLKEHEYKTEGFEEATGEDAKGALSLKAAPDGAIRVVGLAYSGGMMKLPGWQHPVVVDLDGLDVPAVVALLANHENRTMSRVGTVRPKREGQSLTVEGEILSDSFLARDIVRQAKAGGEWQLSIGADVKESELVRDSRTINGQVHKGPFYHVKKSALREVSIIPVGADATTSLRIAAQFTLTGGEQSMDFEKWLESKGFDAATLKDEQKTVLRAAYDAEIKAAADAEKAKKTKPRKPAPETVTAEADTAERHVAEEDAEQSVLKARRAEETRILKVKQLAEKHPDIAIQAISEGWSEEKVELEVLRASYKTLHIQPAHGESITPKVLEAALCLKHGIMPEPKLLTAFGEKVLTQADEMRHMSLRELCEVTARMGGINLPRSVGSTDYVRAAFSSRDLTGILGAVANKALQNAFTAQTPVAPLIAGVASHANFQTHTVYSLIVNGDMAIVGADGELADFNFTEESYTRRLDTRGARVRISRQDLINDSLGAFTRMASALGFKAVNSREKAVFTLINATAAGASHFTAARANYFSGAATNLQLSSLSTAVQMFRDQTGPDGDPVALEPRILLVPTALEETAKALMDRSAALIAVALGSTSAKSREPNANVWAGQFAVHVSPYLSNAALTGYSSTAWYLLGDPNVMPCFEIAYLNGLQTPTVEYFGLDSESDTLGVSWRVYWDFGVAVAEYRAGVKSKGAA